MVGTPAKEELVIEVRSELLYQLFPKEKPRDSDNVYEGAEFLGDCITKTGEPYVFESGQLNGNLEQDLRKILGNNYPKWIKEFSVTSGPEETTITIDPIEGQGQNLMDYLQNKGHWLYQRERSPTKVPK
jgi:hypothetical protein